jgi:triacylglycerol lipase
MITSFAQAGTYTDTRYPIVLIHGLSGFDTAALVIDYWYKIPRALTRDGAEVYVTISSAFNSSEERGEQVLEQVEEILAISGASKVNLIGHSQGGLDARYVAAALPRQIASVTTVGTPHYGSDFADWFRDQLQSGSFTEALAVTLAETLGVIIGALSGNSSNPQDAIAALDQLTSAGADVYNTRYPKGLPTSYCGEGPSRIGDTRYYSWGGTSVNTNLLDLTDPALFVTSLFFGERNDGLVGECSNHFGDVIRDNYRMNHLDLVNQTFGLVHLFETRPTSVFRKHANRLKNAGL